MFLLLLFSVGILYLLYSWLRMRPSNFPPGPPHLPLIGSAPFIPRQHIHLTLEEWRQKYGGVIGFVLGRSPAIFVCSPRLVRELLKRDEFQGRPFNKAIEERSFNKRLGIMFSDGPVWAEQRRFTLRHLKEFGFGKTSSEGLILEEINELMHEIVGKKVQVSSLFNVSSVNVLWGMMAGACFKRTDPRLAQLIENLTLLFRSGNSSGTTLKIIFPFLSYIAPKLVDDGQKIVTEQMNKFFFETIREHQKTLDVNNPRDFIDVYIAEMHKHSEPDSSYTEEQLVTICTDLFSAGAESVGNTIGFVLMYMVLYPEIQQKVHSAIDSHIGCARKPCVQDRASLPYIEAVLMEVQRCNTIAPVTVSHRSTESTYLNGYFIPKNTFIVGSLWSLMQDKDHWGDPENFRPGRFLDNNGKLKKFEFFILFGLGKRLCPGEALARNIIFLFFTSLMQRFRVTLPKDAAKPSTLGLPGFTVTPQPFEAMFTER